MDEPLEPGVPLPAHARRWLDFSLLRAELEAAVQKLDPAERDEILSTSKPGDLTMMPFDLTGHTTVLWRQQPLVRVHWSRLLVIPTERAPWN